MIWWTSLTWLLTPLGLKWYGFTGVALVAAIVASTSVIAIYFVKKVLDLQFIEQVWRQAIAAGTMGTVLLYYQSSWDTSFWHFLAGILTGASVYALMTIILGRNKLITEVQSILRR